MIGARQTDDDFGDSAIVRVMLRLRLNKSLARLSKLRHFYEFEKPNTSDIARSATTCPLKSTHDRTLGCLPQAVTLRLHNSRLSVVGKCEDLTITKCIYDRFLLRGCSGQGSWGWRLFRKFLGESNELAGFTNLLFERFTSESPSHFRFHLLAETLYAGLLHSKTREFALRSVTNRRENHVEATDVVAVIASL